MEPAERRLARCPDCGSYVWEYYADDGPASFRPIYPGHRTDAAGIVLATMLEIASKEAGGGMIKRWKRLANEQLGLDKLLEESDDDRT